MKQIKQIMIIFVMCAFSLVSIGGTAHASLLGDIIGGINALGGAPNGYAIVSGKVTDRAMMPLQGVKVSFVVDGVGIVGEAVTDENGNYKIRAPKAKSGNLSFELIEYRTYIMREYISGDKVENCIMHADSMSGKVTNEAGDPIEGIALSFEEDGGRTGIITVYTDENGNYKVQIPKDDVPYWVTLSGEGYETVRTRIYGYGEKIENFIMK